MAKINFIKIAKEVIETEIQSLKKLKKNIKSPFNKAVQAILNCKKGKVIIQGKLTIEKEVKSHFDISDKETSLDINSGTVEMSNNNVTLLID